MWKSPKIFTNATVRPEGGWTEEVQKCTGQKCTKHQLVLLTIFNVLGLQKANKCWNSPQIDHRLLLAHSWTSRTKIWQGQIMVKSAKSTSSCFCCLSMLYVPYGVFWSSIKTYRGSTLDFGCSWCILIPLTKYFVKKWCGHENRKHQLVRRSTSWCFCLLSE